MHMHAHMPNLAILAKVCYVFIMVRESHLPCRLQLACLCHSVSSRKVTDRNFVPSTVYFPLFDSRCSRARLGPEG